MRAVRFGCVPCCPTCAANYVGPKRDRLQMCRIDAARRSAQVVDHKALWNIPLEKRVGDSMRVSFSILVAHFPIPTPVLRREPFK